MIDPDTIGAHYVTFIGLAKILDTIQSCQEHGVSWAHYMTERKPPNYPVPAIPLIHQWDYSLWCLLENTPPMTDEEWEREEDDWQDYLDSLDN